MILIKQRCRRSPRGISSQYRYSYTSPTCQKALPTTFMVSKSTVRYATIYCISTHQSCAAGVQHAKRSSDSRIFILTIETHYSVIAPTDSTPINSTDGFNRSAQHFIKNTGRRFKTERFSRPGVEFFSDAIQLILTLNRQSCSLWKILSE